MAKMPKSARSKGRPGPVYHQYLTWISRPKRASSSISDPETGRRTWNPPHLKAPVTAVFVFGGSAAWGSGARDDCTMPSELSRRLNTAEDIYLYNKIFCRFFQAQELRFREAGAGFSDQDLKHLAAGTVQYYTQSMMLLDHLARAYGFKYACFWKPALFTEARVLPQETRADVRLEDKKFARLYRFTNQYLADHPLPNHFY